jgi:hypothetical protein
MVLAGSAAAWPLAAQTARRKATPVVGVLSPESPYSVSINGFRDSLQELGYVDGQNVHLTK